MARLGDLLARLDPGRNIRGAQWERICAWYLTHDPTYRSQVRRVWLWGEWPGRWGGDTGIDVVVEDVEGRLWAVQAKVYDPATTVTKADTDTFLSASARPEFSFRLLIATTDLLSRNARVTVEGQEKPVHLRLRADLERAAVEWPESPDRLEAPPPEPKTPREHQRGAIDDIVSGFRGADRGQLIMACGTGKTLVGLWAAEALEARRTLVLVPSLSLLAQTLSEWTANATEPLGFLPVCSDPTVRGRDEWVSSTVELGFPVTTDPDEIAAFLRRRSGPRVVFSTYQSSPRIADAYTLGRVPAFDLVVADEAHRTVGPVGSEFATILDPGAIKAHRRLFCTATPRVFTGRVKKIAGEAEYEIASMDDPERFGEVFHRLTFGEAISRDLLSDYQVVIVGIDDPTYRDMVERGRLVHGDGLEVTDARTLAAQVALAKAMGRYDLRRIISFHGRVKRALEFARDLPGVIDWMPPDETPQGRLWAEHVSGDMPTGLRTARLDRLRHLDPDERGLLSNARCLAEGVDVPTLDGVVFVDPKGSQTDIVQAVGRAIRKAEDKTIGTVVLPVLIGDTDDPEEALAGSVFKLVWSVLRALRDHDEQLAEELDGLRRDLPPVKGPRLPGKVVLDLPEAVGEEFVRALETRVVEQTTSMWEFRFGQLQSYVDEHGTARLPSETVFDGFRLGGWVSWQRGMHNSGTLDLGREERLQALAGWTWDPKVDDWEEAFGTLERYVARHGHSRPPAKSKFDGFKLGPWVSHQRLQGRVGKLDPARAARLEALPGWSWDPFTDDWEDGFRVLKQFVAAHGHARVPVARIFQGFDLGQWVVVRRTYYRNGDITPDRITRLEALPGWSWDPKADDWEQAFSLLKRYVAEHGHARPATKEEFGGAKLGGWVRVQRDLYREGKLEAERAAQLEVLPAWSWDPYIDDWEHALAVLGQYVAEHGHARVPDDRKLYRGIKLGTWVSHQRRWYRQRKLSDEAVARLEALPGWSWDPKADDWEQAFSFLRRYAAERGHARPPVGEEFDGFKLGRWVANLRVRYKTGRLDAERVTRLEQLPGWTWVVRQESRD